MVITSYEDVIINGKIADTNFVVKNSVGVDFIYYVQGNRQEKGVFKISLSSIIPQIKLDEAAIAYIVITKSKPNENPNIKELKSSGGRHRKKRKTKRQRLKQSRKSNKTRTKR
jgi:hypothetical protein